MGVYKRGDRWYIRYVYEGMEYRQSAGVGSDAEQAKAKLSTVLHEIAVGKHTPGKLRSRLTVRELGKAWLADAEATKRSWKCDRGSLRHLNAHLGSRRIGTLTAMLIEGYKRDRLRETYRRGKQEQDRPTTASTVNRELTLLRTMLRRAARDGQLNRNPFDGVKLLPEPPGRATRIMPETEAKLLAAATPRMRALLVLLFNTGLRVGEACALKWENVDLRGGFLAIERSKPLGDKGTKGGGRRDVPLNATARAVLEAMKPWEDAAGQAAAADSFVFRTATGGPFKGNVERAWRATCKAAGVTGLHLHDTRHAFASRLVEQGTDLRLVADLLGHSAKTGLSMVMRYSHVDPHRRREAVEGLVSRPVAVPADGAKEGPDRHTFGHSGSDNSTQATGKVRLIAE